MLVFAGMFHLYRYGKGISKSNVEVVTTNKRKFIFPSIGTSKKEPALTSQSQSENLQDGKTEDTNPQLTSTDRDDIPIPEIRILKGAHLDLNGQIHLLLLLPRPLQFIHQLTAWGLIEIVIKTLLQIQSNWILI